MERGVELIGSELITIEEIQMISGAGYEVAEMDHKIIRGSLGFGSEDLMVDQYCVYHNLDSEEIIEFINGHRYIPNWKLRVANQLDGELSESDIAMDEYEIAPFSLSKAIADFEETTKTLIEKGGINGNSTNH
ncbi:MAG: hypothetical protein GQ574_26735 [Crocinitomix sp.]|nr:hypothetical protein [Crocinitomix sp.]